MTTKEKSLGMLAAVLSYLMWGVLPAYWKAMQTVTPLLILAHRITWSFVMLLVYLLITKKTAAIKAAMKSKRDIFIVIGCAIFISINWFTYIMAVNTGHIVESSMGYYINPLVSIALGVTLLKEKLNLYKMLALVLAAIGVGYMIIQYGSVPWISLILAFSFGIYGLLKKLTGLESAVGLFLETAVLSPLTMAYILYIQLTGGAAFGSGSVHIPVLLVCAGLVTAIPLVMFAYGTKRVEQSTIGILQYMQPTIMLLMGVFVYKEKFQATHFISFGLIWIGFIIYFVSLIREKKMRENGRNVKAAA